MGTSGSFKGSGGKDAAKLRQSIADWLADTETESQTTSTSPPSDGATDSLSTIVPPLQDPATLARVVGLWLRGGGDGPSGNGGSISTGRIAHQGTGRSSGGPQRTVGRVSGPAGRASSMVRAYTTADHQALKAAGLDYLELRALGDPLEVGRRIVSAAFDTQQDGSIEDSESRLIVSELVDWMLEAPSGNPREPAEAVRYLIELMMFYGLVHEVGSIIRTERDAVKRRALEVEMRSSAQVMARRVQLDGLATTSTAMSLAIENGVAQLTEIYGNQR